MKYQNSLCAALSFMIFFCSSGMTKMEINHEIHLISIIKIQQNLLEENISLYIPIDQVIHSPNFFKTRFATMYALDPKNRLELLERKQLEEFVEIETMKCINLIIYKYQDISDQLRLIEERFHPKSLYFLRKTIEHNEKILKRTNLFDYYQQLTAEKQMPSKEEPVMAKQPKTPELTIQEQLQPPVEQPVRQQPKRYIGRSIIEEPNPQQPQEPQGWFSFIWQEITDTVQEVKRLFESAYYFFLWIRTEIIGSPPGSPRER